MNQQTGEWILSFDPGGTTGWARHFLRREGSSSIGGNSYDYQESWSGGQLESDNHHVELWTLLTNLNPDKVICEQFENQHGTPGIHLISRNYIGVIELYCALTNKPLIMQSPGIKQAAWISDEALKRLKLHHPGNVHRNDAVRHIIYYAVTVLKRKDILSALKR